MTNKFVKTFLPLCVLFLFCSCDNFLKGSDTRELLEEAIEIANSNPVTYYVKQKN